MNKNGHTITESCGCCKEAGMILTGEGNWVTCPYCKGAGVRTMKAVHPSHKMSEWSSTILSPTGTPRFYSIKHCLNCEKEEWKHAAGHFLHGLDLPCRKRK